MAGVMKPNDESSVLYAGPWVTKMPDSRAGAQVNVALVVVLVALFGVAVFGLGQWYITNTVARYTEVSTYVEEIYDDVMQANGVVLSETHVTLPGKKAIEHLQQAEAKLVSLLAGDARHQGASLFEDEHLRDDATLLLEQIRAYPMAGPAMTEPVEIVEKYELMSAIAMDMRDDVGRIIGRERSSLLWSAGAGYVVVLLVVTFIIARLGRAQAAAANKSAAFERLASDRLAELETLHAQTKAQMRSLAESNIRMAFLSTALDELRDADKLLLHESGMEMFFEKVVVSAMSITGAQQGAIGIFDDRGSFTSMIPVGVSDQMKAKMNGIPTASGLLGEVYRTGKTLRIDDITADPRFSGLPPGHMEIRSFISMPVNVSDKVRAALYLTNKGAESGFSYDDELMLEMFRPHIQHVLERNELLDEVRKTNEALQLDIQARKRAEAELQQEKQEQKVLIQKLQDAQGQLLQSEKMASIGQLAAGVAHEINNPVGYISSNLGTLKSYVDDLWRIIDLYGASEKVMPAASTELENIRRQKEKLDLDYLRQDLAQLQGEVQEGVQRVRQIVQDLKDFSHVDKAEWQWADLHAGLDSTLNIVHNEIKYKADVVKEYGDLPQVECIASQLNQVFMNLFINAAHAIENRGVITVRTWYEDDMVCVEVQDSGVGIPQESLGRIFEPFYTTKPVGKGTGLGLSLSYGIVKKHGGRIEVESEVGKGTVFKVYLPVRQDKRDVESVQA